MTKAIKLKKGLEIRLKGKAQNSVSQIPVGGIYSIMPEDFYGFKSKPVVKEGDEVLVGDPLFVNKENPELKVVSPVSGKVTEVIRGERRKLLSVKVVADEKQEQKTFEKIDLNNSSVEEIKKILLETGIFAFFRQRPFDVVATPTDTPRDIFVSAFSKMPLAREFSVALEGNERFFELGLKLLSRIAHTNVCFSEEQSKDMVDKLDLKDVDTYIVSGPNPSGNVGVQINNIAPINKGEVVWTISPDTVIIIGRLIDTEKLDFTKTIAVAGSEIKNPSYCKALIGTSLKSILKDNLSESSCIRIINGNPLVGSVASLDGHLSAAVSEVTAIPEGSDKNEVLGWIMPRLNDFSTSRSYFTWLESKKKEYNLDARIKGGERHIIMSGEYDRVIPMNIYAGYLIKAILTGDLDRMEELGIYEVAPEDFATAEFVDSSKLELQRIVREGLDLLRKEL